MLPSSGRRAARLALLLAALHGACTREARPPESVEVSVPYEVETLDPHAVNEGWDRGPSLRLVRNERYWGRKPSMARVRFRLARSPQEAAEHFREGRCQLVQCNSKRLEAELRRTGRAEILRRPSLFVKYIGFNLAREATPNATVTPSPFRNKLVRQAIHLGIDRERPVDALSSDAVPAWQPVPPFIFGFNPSIRPAAHDPPRRGRSSAGRDSATASRPRCTSGGSSPKPGTSSEISSPPWGFA